MGEGEPHFLKAAIEGGIPQLLAGPAGKAISRLIGAGIEIPAVWLEGIAQGTRDKTQARSAISEILSAKVACEASTDPKVLERAMNSMLSKAYRTQRNKDAVAKIAIEELQVHPSEKENEAPSDSWMSKFESYAEDASDEELQAMFGRLLAGELRAPRSVAPLTLHFVSMLEKDVADLIQRVLPFTLDDGMTLLECIKPNLTVKEITYLEQSGFWTADKILTFSTKNGQRAVQRTRGEEGFFVQLGEGNELAFKVGLLSRAGRDLLRVVQPPFEFAALSEQAKSKGAEHFGFGEIYQDGPNLIMPQPKILF